MSDLSGLLKEWHATEHGKRAKLYHQITALVLSPEFFSTLAQEPAGQSEAKPVPPGADREKAIEVVANAMATKSDHRHDRQTIEFFRKSYAPIAVDAMLPLFAAHPTVKVSGDAAEMRERCAQWHDQRARDCRAIAAVNQDNELGADCETHAIDHEIAAEAIRALPLTQEGRSDG